MDFKTKIYSNPLIYQMIRSNPKSILYILLKTDQLIKLNK
jgi:hypothetical protein